MCNEYARELEAGRIIRLMEEMKDLPPFAWQSGRIPNDQGPAESIKIRDAGLVVRLRSNTLVGEMLTWGWKTPRGKPVFNFISEGRDFSESDRVLILATSFYEYTEPKTAKVKLKDKHRFTLKGHSWFWIAGIVKQDCFTMLTTRPGPDMIPYHDRQICVLPPAQAIAWLGPDQRNGILETPPAGTLAIKTMRKNGETSPNTIAWRDGVGSAMKRSPSAYFFLARSCAIARCIFTWLSVSAANARTFALSPLFA